MEFRFCKNSLKEKKVHMEVLSARVKGLLDMVSSIADCIYYGIGRYGTAMSLLCMLHHRLLENLFILDSGQM